MARYPHELIDGDYIEGALVTDMDFENFSEEGLRILDQTFRGCTFDGAKFDRGHFSDVRFESCAAPDLSVIDAGLQDVLFEQSRLGGIQAYGTSWTRGVLKGTIMSAEQFLDLAPSFARLLGITLK